MNCRKTGWSWAWQYLNACMLSNDFMKENWLSNWIDDQMVCNDKGQNLCPPGNVSRTFQMSESTFDKPLETPYPKLQKDDTMSNKSTGGLSEVISCWVTIAKGIYFLAGASCFYLTTTNGVSDSSVFLSGNFFDSVNTCGRLKIVFPHEEEDYKAVLTGYIAKHFCGLMKECIECIDGLLVEIECALCIMHSAILNSCWIEYLPASIFTIHFWILFYSFLIFNNSEAISISWCSLIKAGHFFYPLVPDSFVQVADVGI